MFSFQKLLIECFIFRFCQSKYHILSSHGNPNYYKVNGHVYKVMKHVINYKMRGIASWYGVDFNKKRTSSGEYFDMYAMTAAHKTLPLPTYLLVKNLNNGNTVIVRVNDRGPFYSNRIIDVSYAAAIKLGLLKSGIAPVEIQVINIGDYIFHDTIQIFSFKSKKLAFFFYKKLKNLIKFPVEIKQYRCYYTIQVKLFLKFFGTDMLRIIQNNFFALKLNRVIEKNKLDCI
ncbi:septal ring lytic transglycosylase RlpA family protein [Candidatus Legionella polyplacis]|uniref:Endolytic peptidoglycan transglycosylase RlpA n=1 Tax=Candidatus Legionella polyplacis TaxID=2005262 RepID=A0ABZ2H0E4_9GAMM